MVVVLQVLGGVQGVLIPVTQLTIVAVAPCKHLVVGCQQGGVFLSAADLDSLASLFKFKLCGDVCLQDVGTLKAELSIHVLAKRIHSPVLVDAHCKVSPCGYLDNAAETFNLLGNILLLEVSMSKSSLLTLSPGIDFPLL